jgi:hypothetical protein
VLLRQLRNGYAGLARALREGALEVERMIRSPFARRPIGRIGHFGSHYFLVGATVASLTTRVQTVQT